MPPDFLAIGHVSLDASRDSASGWRLGGTVAYATRLAGLLGYRVGAVTSVAPDIALDSVMPGVELVTAPSVSSTRFENRYDGAQRRQSVLSVAGGITGDVTPPDWRAIPMILVGPIIGEVDIKTVSQFSPGLLGICLQGWLRRPTPDGTVEQLPLTVARPVVEGLSSPAVIFLSDEDIGPDRSAICLLEQWAQSGPRAPIIALTKGRLGAAIWHDGGRQEIASFDVPEVDPTGAGDIFAAAFLVRYHECRSVADAAAFAGAAAALSVGGPGVDAVPDRAAINQLLSDQPEVRLQ